MVIHVIAVITAKPGKREDILVKFRENMAACHAEDGCIEYRPVVDVDNAGKIQTKYGSDSFVVIEKWESMEALGAHARSAHMAEYAKQVGDMIADRKVHVLTSAE